MENRRVGQEPVPRVAVIGCGRIGSLFDEEAPIPVLTHAGAYQRTERARLVALCDSDPARLAEAGRRRNIEALYTDYEQLLRNERLDIISLCTPASERLPALRAALGAGVKTIFCEKPVAVSVKEAERIARLALEYGASIAVNYLRRWQSGILEAARLLQSGELGRVQRVTVYYTKGIANNGSHMIDLLNLFFGLPARARTLRQIADDYRADDPTLDCVLEYEGDAGEFPVYLIASDHRRFSLFELDVLGARGRLRIAENGASIRLDEVVEDRTFPGYFDLQPARAIPNDVGAAFSRAVENVIEVSHGKKMKPLCDIRDATDALRVVAALKESAVTGAVVDLK